MTIALQILQLIFYSVSILFMLTFMFIGIWSFIIFIKISKLKETQNTILSDIKEEISSLSLNTKTLSTELNESSIESVDNDSLI